MSDDLQLNRDDFEDCFADAPQPVSVADDLARGQHHLRRRRRMAGGAVAGVVAVVVLAVPLLTSLTFPPGPIDPAVPTTVGPTAPSPGPTQTTAPAGTCTGQTIKIVDAITDPAKRPVVDVKPVPTKDKDGKATQLVTIGATGEVLLEEGSNDTSENEGTTRRPGRLVLWDPATGKRTTVRGPKDLHEGTLTFHAVFDRDYVVWVETPDTSIETSTWKMYAFDRRTGKISEVATAPRREVPAGIPPEFVPRLWNGSVYWEVARDDAKLGAPKVVDIYTRKLDLREPARRIVGNAVQPTPTDGWLYYEQYDRDRTDDKYAVYRMSFDGATTELVHLGDGETTFDLSADGDVAAWDDGQGIVVYRGTTLVARLVPLQGHTAGGVTMGDGTIGFDTVNSGGEKPSSYLLDLRAGCSLYQLNDGDYGATTIAAGGTVAWGGPDPDGSHHTWTVGRLR